MSMRWRVGDVVNWVGVGENVAGAFPFVGEGDTEFVDDVGRSCAPGRVHLADQHGDSVANGDTCSTVLHDVGTDFGGGGKVPGLEVLDAVNLLGDAGQPPVRGAKVREAAGSSN